VNQNALLKAKIEIHRLKAELIEAQSYAHRALDIANWYYLYYTPPKGQA
jgi:hypothetical protein